MTQYIVICKFSLEHCEVLRPFGLPDMFIKCCFWCHLNKPNMKLKKSESIFFRKENYSCQMSLLGI